MRLPVCARCWWTQRFAPVPESCRCKNSHNFVFSVLNRPNKGERNKDASFVARKNEAWLLDKAKNCHRIDVEAKDGSHVVRASKSNFHTSVMFKCVVSPVRGNYWWNRCFEDHSSICKRVVAEKNRYHTLVATWHFFSSLINVWLVQQRHAKTWCLVVFGWIIKTLSWCNFIKTDICSTPTMPMKVTTCTNCSSSKDHSTSPKFYS